MRYIKNQCGYAMVEVILTITLIAVIAATVLPNISNAFKVVYVNYEMLNLYGDMRLIQSINRITSYNKQDIFSMQAIHESSAGNFYIKSDKQRYFFYNVTNESTPLIEHNLSQNFSFETKLLISAVRGGTISNEHSKNPTSFTLRMLKDLQQCNPVIVVDSVGRIRFNRE